jgi:hypothetical protein
MGRGYKKLAALLATAATIVGLATGVLTLRDQLFPRIDPPQPARPEQTQSVPHVRGHVVDSRTGQPYAGAWVEFKNLSGGNVHIATDRNGVYDLPVPEGVYTALAGDDRDMNMGFDVVNRASNAVEVPSDSVVDFVARPIS